MENVVISYRDAFAQLNEARRHIEARTGYVAIPYLNPRPKDNSLRDWHIVAHLGRSIGRAVEKFEVNGVSVIVDQPEHPSGETQKRMHFEYQARRFSPHV